MQDSAILVDGARNPIAKDDEGKENEASNNPGTDARPKSWCVPTIFLRRKEKVRMALSYKSFVLASLCGPDDYVAQSSVENKERNKTVEEKVMDKSTQEALGTMRRLNKSWHETYQVIAQSTFDVQGRSIQYMQSVITDGVDTLKEHIESSSRWWLQTTHRVQSQQEPKLSPMEDAIEASKRNALFLQRTLEHGVETFKSNTETMRALTQTLMQKAQEQNGMLWP